MKIVNCLIANFSILLWINLVQSKPQLRRLTNLIKHYEPVTYDHETFHAAHHRAKRSTDSILKLNFHAFGNHFKLRMRRDTQSMAHSLEIEAGNGTVTRWLADNLYKGIVKGFEKSAAYGVVHSSGLFEGTIRTGKTVYKIEPASKYNHLKNDNKNDVYHSIIYNHRDVEYDKVNTQSKCESDELHRKIKEQLYEDNTPQGEDESHNDENHTDEGKFKYQAPKSKSAHSRRRRAVDRDKTQCTLYIQSDHKYYEYWQTDEAVINEMALHTQAVNAIYELIDFDTDGSAEGITFIVKRVKLWRSATETGYKFPDNYDVATYLQTFSQDEDFDEYCLAYIYTYRDFDGGTLGLAWTGDTATAGGVCERMGMFSGVQKSLNTGLITILNFGQVQPHAISYVTFAHELGHNFGSPHDTDGSSCAPGGDGGNYIMYANAVDGNKPNNERFSDCSVANINPVLLDKARDADDGCFQIPVTTICGNGVVEDGEACDCGYDTECADTCCNPQVDSSVVVTNATTPCTLVAGAECSPTQGICCNSTCSFISLNDSFVCRDSSGCRDESLCDGLGVSCPASNSSADGTVCSSSRVCQSGECTGSLCLKYTMVECQCEPETPSDFYDVALCHLCCTENGTANGTCTTSYDLPLLPDTDVEAGRACMDYAGYCDVFSKCRAVVPDGILTSILSAATVKNWLKSNWYFPVAGAVLMIIGIIVMVKCCTPKKKSDKEKKKKDKDKKSKVGPTTKKGPAPRRDQALTPPKAKPYKVYDNNNGPQGGGGYPGAPGGGYPGGGGYPAPPQGGYPGAPNYGGMYGGGY